MVSYYAGVACEFRLERAGPMPLRNAQLGALHAIAAHFTRYRSEAIVAVPTGVGKTVVAVAAPHVLEARGRVLVVVPSRVLRRQTVEAFRHQNQLRKVGLLPVGTTNPVVVELDEIPSSWSVVEDADVVVALPQSLGPLLERETPPRDLFEVVVFDEAHHTPASSWTEVRTTFDAATVLLTATPYRRDLRELPGRLAYEYPLSHAIADGVYTPVEFVGVETIGLAEAEIDRRIAERAVDLLRGELHAGTSSRLLVRAKTRQRVDDLAALYRELGARINVVRGDLTPATVENRIDQVRRGEADGLAFVGVLGEGFDCPELKIGAYHDKHRSLPVTMQFIGRLSRRSATAGPAQVVAAYDTLRSDTWELYRSDAVWADLVPRLAERATSDVERRKQLLERMPPFPHDEVSLHDICLRIGVGIFTADDLEFDLTHDQPGDLGLDVGSRFAHGNIVWAHIDTHEQLLMFVTQHRDRPDWIRTPVLDAARYEMHVVLLRPDEAGRPLIVVSSSSRDNEYRLAARVAGAPDRIKLADVEFMRRFLGVAEIQAVQHLGTRNTSAGSQAMSYTTRAGSSVEDGTYSEDLRDDVVGHVGTTCIIAGEPYCAGVSLGKSRIWVNKYFPIDRYIEFIDRLLIAMGAGQPGNIRRLRTRFEVSLHHWPEHTDVLAVANHPDLTTDAISIAGHHPTDVTLEVAPRPESDDTLPLTAPALGWTGWQRPNGTFAKQSHVIDAETLHGTSTLEELLLAYPPTVYFRDGSTARGGKLAPPPDGTPQLPDDLFAAIDWVAEDVAITKEKRRPGHTDSIHEWVDAALLWRFHAQGWIVFDDGSREVADHFVIEPAADDIVRLHLIHSKASTEKIPGIRVADLDELVGQIVRSRRWFEKPPGQFWKSVAHRIRNRPSTQLLHDPTSTYTEQTLIEACRKWIERPPLIEPAFVAVQPGLDTVRLTTLLDTDGPGADAFAETLHSSLSWVGRRGSLRIVGS